MTTITFLGVGAAGAPAGMWQSNMLIRKDGRGLLVDAGSDIRHSLASLQEARGVDGAMAGPITAANFHDHVHAVYLSHAHADHVGGLEWVGLISYFRPNRVRLPFFCNHKLMNEAWEHSLRGGLQTIEGKVADLTDFFLCNPIEDNGEFTWEGINFQPVQTVHVMSGRMIQHSFGLLVRDHSGDGKQTFLTTDTQFAPSQLMRFYQDSDLILHDCETTPWRSNVHAHYDDLAKLPPEIKSKMWLYHYNQPSPPQNAVADGFCGFVKPGQSFSI